MLNLPVKLFRITVAFNPLGVMTTPPTTPNPVLLCDDFKVDAILNKHYLSIPQGLSMIVFDVMTLPGGDLGEATFVGDPITWYNDTGGLIATPEAFKVQWFTGTHCNMLDFNTAKNPNTHPFMVTVYYGGVAYSSDPMIVNEPPAPVG